MAHRGRKRNTGSRGTNGRLSRAGRSTDDAPNYYLAAQRIESLDPVLAAECRQHACIPEQHRTRKGQDILLATTARAKPPNLSFPVGRAFEAGLLSLGPDSDGRELLQAADVYASLHRVVWGPLPKDIEADITRRYGHDAWRMLLEVGRVAAPAPPASNFRKLVGQTPTPNDGQSDPEEYLQRRLRHADRYAAARAALQREGLDSLAIVENHVLDGFTPQFMRPGVPHTARSISDHSALVRGLTALANIFGLFDRRSRTE